MGVKVSVILPFFNAGITLERAIKSIANQSLASFECLLVDNNSTDQSITIAREWVHSDARFIYLQEKRQGVVFATETGFLLSRGEYIARMDADDESMPDRLGLQSRFLDEHGEYDVVAGRVEYMPHTANTEGFSRYVAWVNRVETYADILNQRFIESPVVNPSAMWRRSVAEKYGLYKWGHFPEDYEMWLRWLHHGVQISKVKDCVLRWYDSDSRLTRTNKIYSDDAFFSIKTRYLAEFLKQNNRHYPNVAIWGASRISRKFTQMLVQYGINISFYIDTKKNRQLDKPVVFYDDIPSPNACFVLVYMRHHDIRDQICKFLTSRLFVEGADFVLMS